MADATAVRDITDKLENGVKNLFESGKYADYLQTMSRFHRYSTKNTLLIHFQSPEARRVGGFRFWQEQFNRHVKKGEHGIKIFAPIANKGKDIEVEKLDPVTKLPVIDENGQPVMERLSPTSNLQVRFKLVTVFSEQQTEGDPLPELAETLTGDVERFGLFMDALRAVSPLPIVIEPLTDQDGYCEFGKKIGIREGMSEIQTVAAVIHEITHAKLHDINSLVEGEKPKSAKVAELEAESVAYVVSAAFQIDTGANSFGYLLEWNPDAKMKDFNASLDTIRKTAASLIDAIEEKVGELAKERGIDLTEKPEVKEESGTMEYTEFQQKGFAIAESIAKVPLQERLNIIAQTFGYKSANIETNPCTGKWRGTSDISIVLGNGRATLFIGNERTPNAKKASVISERVNNTLAKYNPQTVAEAKQRAGIALLERERADNAVATERGLKSYTLLNVELNDGSNSKTGAYLGWYYITVAVDGKIFGLCESGLNSDIARGEFNSHEKYFVAGALKDTEVDFVFSNVGHSSESASYKMELTADVLERAQETLARRERFQSALEGMKTVENNKPTIENRLYDKLSELFPDVMSQKYSYMKLESPGFEPLSLEWIFGDRLSVMHTYTMNGDLMYDPMMEFSVNSKERTLTASSFEQSMPPLYQYFDDDGIGRSVDGNGKSREIRNLNVELADFSAQWFKNLSEQGHIPVRATIWNNGGIDEVDVSVTFDKDGNAILPEPEEQRKPVGHIIFRDSGEVVSYYSADEMLSAFKNAMDSLGADGVRYRGVVDEDLEQKLFAAYASEYGEDIPAPETQILADNLPDPTVTIAEMNAFGYTAVELLPLSQARAIELFENGNPVYLLYPDNTEAMVFDADEIKVHDGFCGIEVNDWERIRAAETSHDNVNVRASEMNAREADLLYGDNPYYRENKFGIYQIRDDIDEPRNFRSASMKELEAHGLTPNRDNYELVYTAALPDRIEFLSDKFPALNRLYEQFNIDHPADYTGRSMSIGDVVVLRCNGDITAHFVDSEGYIELSSFTGDEHNDNTISKIGTKQADKSAGQKPVSKTAPTLLDELAEAKQLVARGDKSVAKQNEREV